VSDRHVVIAIDGPAASGKSSTAQWVARKLGFFHVDSGSLYRAATAVQLARGTDPDTWTEDQVLDAAREITFRAADGTFLPLIHAAPSDQLLRGGDVTRNVSRVAQMPCVRDWVNAQVRKTAESQNVVVDGRDIGTVVFPDATLKVFLVADPWERARRRLTQRLGRVPTDSEIAEETDLLVHRDAKDATQTVQATDAVLIDTTYLTQEDQVDRIVALAKAVTQRPNDTSAVDG
jgi:cytidylate kinase